jgi:hypothetical protein
MLLFNDADSLGYKFSQFSSTEFFATSRNAEAKILAFVRKFCFVVFGVLFGCWLVFSVGWWFGVKV